jgi:hypothetical protein
LEVMGLRLSTRSGFSWVPPRSLLCFAGVEVAVDALTKPQWEKGIP